LPATQGTVLTTGTAAQVVIEISKADTPANQVGAPKPCTKQAFITFLLCVEG